MKAERIIRWLLSWIGVFFIAMCLLYVFGDLEDRWVPLISCATATAAVIDLLFNILSLHIVKLSAVQIGARVYVLEGKRQIGVAMLDNERPLNEREIEEIIATVERVRSEE